MRQYIEHCMLALFTMLQYKKRSMKKSASYTFSTHGQFSYSCPTFGVLFLSLAYRSKNTCLEREKVSLINQNQISKSHKLADSYAG